MLTSLLKDVIKGTYEQPDEEIHRCGRVPSTGTSVPQFARISITKHSSSSNNRNGLSHSAGSWMSSIKVLSALVPPRRYEEESVLCLFSSFLWSADNLWFSLVCTSISAPLCLYLHVASCVCMCVHIPPFFVSTEGARFMMVQLNIFKLYNGVTVKRIQQKPHIEFCAL